MMVCHMTQSKVKVKVTDFEIGHFRNFLGAYVILYQYACNQKTNSELWYSQDNILILTGQIFHILPHLVPSDLQI